MDDTVIVGSNHIFRKQKSPADILAYLACHVVTECTVDDGVLVRIFLLRLLIVAFKKTEDLSISRVHSALLLVL